MAEKIIDPDMLGEHIQPNPLAATRGIKARRAAKKPCVSIRLDEQNVAVLMEPPDLFGGKKSGDD